MARARNIKPGFFKNEYLAQCEYGARLVFAGLWTLADREGRLEDRPMRIKAEIMPFDSCDIDDLLNQLAKYKFITRYEVAGCKYIQINNFCKHQNPHVKEPASTIPAWCAHQSGPADSLLLIPDSPLPINPLTPKGESDSSKPRTKRERTAYAPGFEDWYLAYPRHVGKDKAAAAHGRAIRRIAVEQSIEPADAAAWLLGVTKRFAESPAGTAGEFVPYPATWLNAGRFNDDEAEWQRKSTNGANHVGPGQRYQG